MQSAYIGKLMELAEKDRNVWHILADSGTGYDEMFRKNFPDQIHNFGIAEENMAAAAAGMATVGKIPFVFTAGAFLAYRSLEFIRDDICFQNQNVKIVGMGSGLSWSSLGPTHHTTEDVAVLRAIPNLMILSPATPKQVSECVELAYRHKGPVYIRLGMNKEKEFFCDEYCMDEHKNDMILKGSDIAIVSTGSILEEAAAAAELLSQEGISARVVNICCLKPFVYDGFMEGLSRRLVFTVEEHNIIGGLGSIISEVIAREGMDTRVKTIGIRDTFAEGYGTHKMVRKINGLDADSIYRIIKSEVS